MVKKNRKPHRYKKRKPVYRYRFFWFSVLFLILFSSLIYFLFFSEFFKIKKINIVGLEQVSEEQLNLLGEENKVLFFPSLRSVIEEEIENKILFFPKKNMFLINLNKAKEEVLEKFPQIAEIQISRKFPDNLNVLIRERNGLAVFCFFIEEENEEENCFVLDEEGVVFETKKDIEALVKITDERKVGLPVLGEKIIEKDKITRLLEINFEIENNLNLSVKEIIVSLEKLTVKTEEDWDIYFNLKEDVEWQLTKLRVLLEEKISEQERTNLEYIELRFGNFANPKYRDKD